MAGKFSLGPRFQSQASGVTGGLGSKDYTGALDMQPIALVGSEAQLSLSGVKFVGSITNSVCIHFSSSRGLARYLSWRTHSRAR